ncbi:serine/threonine-protein kinase [Nonomuraea typhae]|uniref:serine/threonine-protein kinase n=1 Tax=Nonomuraea typhae TaxID=2603600 RepID=UPI0012F9AFA7|nr:serine/threonine-protein kinase [Nonomuraea typhae]
MSRLADLRADDPHRLGDYRLAGRLGQGGQGTVFLGHTPAGGQVAVKLLHAHVAADPGVRRRFLGEVEAVRRVAPFCTAQVLDASLDGDRPFIVSEYVDGVSLRDHIIAKGPRTGSSLDRLAIGTATALAAIHRAGVVHRDFKPGNVLLGMDGPRVIDFGISRLMDATATVGKAPVGTPAYLAPERIEGEAAGPPADLYAWALTLAYAANGRHAYRADTYQEILARILYGRADLGTLSGRLRDVVQGCLARDPAARPTAEDTLGYLLGRQAGADMLSSGARAAIGTTEPHLDLTPAAETITAPAPKRRVPKWQVAVGVAGLLAGVAGFVLWWQSGQGDLTGTWTGSADHPSADRVFPVEIRLAAEGTSTMRWGADLHCSGRLVKTSSVHVYGLDEVKGKECYPGTLRMFPDAGGNQAVIEVNRSGQQAVTYSGKVSRPS